MGAFVRVVLFLTPKAKELLHDECANADLTLIEAKRRNARPIKAGYALKQQMYCEPVSYSAR